MSRWVPLVALTILAVLLGIVAVVAGIGTSNNQANNKEYTIGEPALLNDRMLTVNAVQRNFVPDSTERPKQGDEYIRVNITLVNTSDSAIDYNPLQFSIEDPNNGIQRNTESVQQVPDALNVPGTIGALGTLNGNLVFQAPQGATNLKLVYKPNPLSGDTITVAL